MEKKVIRHILPYTLFQELFFFNTQQLFLIRKNRISLLVGFVFLSGNCYTFLEKIQILEITLSLPRSATRVLAAFVSKAAEVLVPISMTNNSHKTNSWEATALLVGITIGSGVLGLPFVMAKAGFLTGFLILIVAGAAMLLLNLCFGEAVLRTPQRLQMVGYAEKYLGKNGRRFMSISISLMLYGCLIVYLTLGGEILFNFFGGSVLFWSLVFWFLGAILLYSGLNATKKVELVLIGVMALAVFVIFFLGYRFIDIKNLAEFNLKSIFLPYGIIIYALFGLEIIPEMYESLAQNKHKLKKCIFWGTVLPIIIYLAFAFIIVGSAGKDTPRIATLALEDLFGFKMALAANIFALLAVATSFFGVALAQKSICFYDWKLPSFSAFLAAILPPLILILLGITDFIKVMGYVGLFSGAFVGVGAVLIFDRAKKMGERRSEYCIKRERCLVPFLIILFAGGLLCGLIFY